MILLLVDSLNMEEHSDSASKAKYFQSGHLEQIKLTRFFSKLLEEALHFGCNGIEFTNSGEALSVTLTKNRANFKEVSIKLDWYEPIVSWLVAHQNSLSDKFTKFDKNIPTNISADVAVRTTQGIVKFSVECFKALNRTQVIRCSSIEKCPCEDFIEPLKLSNYSRFSLESMLGQTEGLIIACCSDMTALERTKSFLLNVSNGVDITNSEFARDFDALKKAAETDLVIYGVQALDAVEGLYMLRKQGFKLEQLNIIGSLCQGFCPKVCRSCAREAVIDPALIEDIPNFLKPKAGASYLVGRGCEACNHTGYAGWIGVQNVCFVDDAVKELLRSHVDQAVVVKTLYGRGLRSLLEDGLSKAWSGLTCLDPIYRLTRVLPDLYLRLGSQSEESPGKVAERIEVNDDFFVDANAKTVKKVDEAQNKIFRAGAFEEGGGDDQPLFAVSKTGKIRDKKMVLVVEDDPDQREILDMVFRSANYQVSLATDGIDALEKLQSNPPDVIVTDLMMPKMDGLQLVQRLKSQPALKSIPVLVLTVLSDSDKEYQLLDIGADDYCEKTIQRKLLLKRLEKIIEKT